MTQTKVTVHRCRFVHYLSPAITHIKRSGNQIAVSRQNGTVQIWSPKGATWFHEKTIPAPEDPLETICWVKNRLFRGTLGGFIDEISSDTLLPIFTTSSYGGAVWSMDINPTGEVMAVGCEDGMIRLFRVLDQGLEYLSVLERQETKVLSLAWHPYKPIVVVGSTDGTVRAVHVDTGRTIHVMTLDRVKGEDNIVWDVLVLKNGTIVCADSLGQVSFWDGRTATLLQTIKVHDADVLCLAASDDGKRVYSSGVDQKIIKMELIEQDGITKWKHTGSKRYHTHDVRSILLIEDKPWDVLVSGGIDTSLIFSGPTQDFDRMKQERLGIVPRGVFSHAAEPKFVMTLFDDSCRIWKLADVASTQDFNDKQRIPTESHSHIVTIKSKGKTNLTSGSISQDGTIVVLADAYQTKLYSIEYDPINISVLRKMDLGAYSTAFTPDGQLLLGGFDGSVHIIDLNTWKAQSYKQHTKAVTRLGVSSCGTFILSGDSSKKIVCYNTEEKKVQGILPTFTSMHTSFSFHPTDPIVTIATASNDVYQLQLETIKFTSWSNEYSQRIQKLLNNRKEVLLSVLYLPNNSYLFYGNSFIFVLKPNDKSDKWSLDHRYQSIVDCYWNSIYSELVVIERPVLQLLAELPDAYRKPRFGK